MQPTYMPWLGYFSLIHDADLFVFLDDVQFARRSWQQRNRICLNKKEHLLTVPVKKRGKRDQLIYEVQVNDDEKWRDLHLAKLANAYKKSPFYEDVFAIVKGCLLNDSKSLSQINIMLIKQICSYLGITTRFALASDISCDGSKSEHLLQICHYFGATTYLSALGSKDYIEDEGCFRSASIPVSYQSYTPSYYTTEISRNDSFIPYLSVVDLLYYHGPDSFDVILRGKNV